MPDRVEQHGGEDYVVRRVTGSATRRTYTCPACHQPIRPATPHVVAWPVLPTLRDELHGDTGWTNGGTGTRRAGDPGSTGADWTTKTGIAGH